MILVMVIVLVVFVGTILITLYGPGIIMKIQAKRELKKDRKDNPENYK